MQYNTNRGCLAWVKPTLSHISTVKSINFWLLNDLEPRRCRRPSPRPRLRIDGVQYHGSGAESTDTPEGLMRFGFPVFFFLTPPPTPWVPHHCSSSNAISVRYLCCFTNQRLNEQIHVTEVNWERSPARARPAATALRPTRFRMHLP